MTDIVALVADNLDLWTSAIERKSGAGRGGGKKLSLHGIARLRALILDLAVQGKLVSQDAEDEPASKLLARIFAERKILQQRGQVSKPKKLIPLNPGEIAVPSSWAAARFGDLFSLEYGNNLPEPKRSGSGEYNVFGSNGVVGSHNQYCVEKPCLVVGRKGSAGAVHPSYAPCWVTDVAYYCVPPTGITIDYLLILFRTLRLDELSKGIKPGLNRNEANVLPVAIPPTAEQQRIVGKVDELMALCDALEQESADALAAHQTLVETLLAILVNSADATELAAHWVRLETHFDTLFTTEVSINALKQTVLELAVRGKLTHKLPSDEPAKSLLAAIRTHSDNHEPKGRARSPKTAAPVAERDWPFRLPNGWLFARFGEILVNRDAERVPISSEDRARRAGDYDYYGASGVIDKIDDYLFDEDLLLIGEDGANLINRSTPIAFIASGKYWVNNHAHVLEAMSKDLLRYMEIYINAIDLKPYVTGTAQPKMNQAKMNTIIVALPSADEIPRIVTKVDELMTLCEALKARLGDAAETQKHLADAIVERAAA